MSKYSLSQGERIVILTKYGANTTHVHGALRLQPFTYNTAPH